MASKKDKLSEFKDDISLLLSKKYSIAQIREFLINYKKVEVSKDCLYKYHQKIKDSFSSKSEMRKQI